MISVGTAIVSWILLFAFVLVPIGIYLHFRIITLKCESLGQNISVWWRLFLAVFPFYKYPRAGKISLNRRDQIIALIGGLISFSMILVYILAVARIIEFAQ